jgi:transcription elongation factor Elf1
MELIKLPVLKKTKQYTCGQWSFVYPPFKGAKTMTVTELYTVHCTVCGNIETDKDNKEIYFYNNWRDHVRECSDCGALETEDGEGIFSFLHEFDENGKEIT